VLLVVDALGFVITRTKASSHLDGSHLV
jgi:hypothetical protein